MFDLPTILAVDLGDLIGALVPIVVFLFWLIGQIASKGKAAPAKPVARPQQQQQPQQQRPVPAERWRADEDEVEVIEAKPAGQKSIFDEIEQFLAKARQQMQQGGQPAAPVAERRTVPQPTPRRPVVIEAEAADIRGRRQVADHVRQHLSTSDMEQHIESLGDEVEMADERMEAHLAEKFHHQIGRLASAANAPVTVAAPTAEEKTAQSAAFAAPVGFAALLASTESLRQAVVLNEILPRPVDRW